MQQKNLIKKNKIRNVVIHFLNNKTKIKTTKIAKIFFAFGGFTLQQKKINKNLGLILKQKLNYIKKNNNNLIFINCYLFNFFYRLNLREKSNKFKTTFCNIFIYNKFLLEKFYGNISNIFVKKNIRELVNKFVKNIIFFSRITTMFMKIIKSKNKIKNQLRKKNFLALKHFYFQNSIYFGTSKKIFKIKKKKKIINKKMNLPQYLFKKENLENFKKIEFKKFYTKKIKFVFPKIEVLKNKRSLENNKNIVSISLDVLRPKLAKTKEWYRKHTRYSKFKKKVILRKYKIKRKSKNFYKKLFFKKQNAQKTTFSKLFGFLNGESVLLQKKKLKLEEIKKKEKKNYSFLLDHQIFGTNFKNTKKKDIYNLQINNLINNVFIEYLNLKKNDIKNINTSGLLTFRHDFLFFFKNFFFLRKERKEKKINLTGLKPGFLVINSYKNNLFASFLSNKKEVSVKLSLGLLKFNEKKYDFLSYVNVFRGLSFLLFYYGNIGKMLKTYQKNLKAGEIRINFIKRNVLRNKRKRKRIILQIFLLKYARYIKKVKKRFERKIKKNKNLSLFLSKNKKFKNSLQKIFMNRVKSFLTENYRAKRQKRKRYRRYSYFESRMRFLVLMELEMLRSEKKLAHNLRYGIVNPGFGFKKQEEIETNFVDVKMENSSEKKRKIKTSLADYRKKLYSIAEKTTKQHLNVYRNYIKAKFRRPFFFRNMDLYRPKRIRMYNVKKEFKNDKMFNKIKSQHRKVFSLFKFKKLLTKKKRMKKRRTRKKKISIKNLQIFKLLNSKVQKKVLSVIYDFRKVITKRSSLFSKYKVLSKKQKLNLIYIGKFIFPKVWSKLLSREKKIKKMVLEVKRHNLWINTFLKDVTYGQGKPQTVEKILADKSKYRARYIAKKKKRRKFPKRGFFQRKLQQVRSLKRKTFVNLRKKKIFLQKFRRFTLNFIMSWGLFFFKKQLKIKLIKKTLNYFQYSLRQFILIKNYLSQIKTKKYFIRIKMKYTGDLADLIYFNLARFFQTAQRKKWMKFYSKLIRIYFAKYKNVKRKKNIYLAEHKK